MRTVAEDAGERVDERIEHTRAKQNQTRRASADAQDVRVEHQLEHHHQLEHEVCRTVSQRISDFFCEWHFHAISIPIPRGTTNYPKVLLAVCKMVCPDDGALMAQSRRSPTSHHTICREARIAPPSAAEAGTSSVSTFSASDAAFQSKSASSTELRIRDRPPPGA